MSRRAHPSRSPSCAASTCSTASTTQQLAEWLAVAQPQELAPGELIVEEQDHVPGLILLLEGTAATHMTGRGRPEPVGRQVAPTWIGAISVLTEDPLPVRIVAETACRLAIVPSAEFLRLVFAQQAVHQTVIRRIAPVMQRLTRDRAEPRAAGLAGHDGGGPRARAQQPGRRRAARGVAAARGGRHRAVDAREVREVRRRARGRRGARRAAAGGAGARGGRDRAADARRLRRRGRAAGPARGARRARGVAAGRAAGRGGRRPGRGSIASRRTRARRRRPRCTGSPRR